MTRTSNKIIATCPISDYAGGFWILRSRHHQGVVEHYAKPTLLNPLTPAIAQDASSAFPNMKELLTIHRLER